MEALKELNNIGGYVPQNVDHRKAIETIKEALLAIHHGHWFFEPDRVKTAFEQLGVLESFNMAHGATYTSKHSNTCRLSVIYNWHEHRGLIEFLGNNPELTMEENKKHCISSAIVFLSKFIPFSDPYISFV